MSLTRHERILSIEATKIEILHPSHEPGRTASFHISRGHDCKPSKRLPNSFKLIVDVNRELKRYDFEAQTQRKSRTLLPFVFSFKSSDTAVQERLLRLSRMLYRPTETARLLADADMYFSLCKFDVPTDHLVFIFSRN